MTIEGTPNFRQVPGYLVFGTGQPTKLGFINALEYLTKDTGAKKVLWTNMRQEPVVYMNGQSFTPRLRERYLIQGVQKLLETPSLFLG